MAKNNPKLKNRIQDNATNTDNETNPQIEGLNLGLEAETTTPAVAKGVKDVSPRLKNEVSTEAIQGGAPSISLKPSETTTPAVIQGTQNNFLQSLADRGQKIAQNVNEPLQKAKKNTGKFLGRTAVNTANMLLKGMEYSTDFTAEHAVDIAEGGPVFGPISAVGEELTGVEASEVMGMGNVIPKKIEDKWTQTLGSVQDEAERTLAKSAEQKLNKLKQSDFLKTSEAWQQSSIKEKLTDRLPQTVFNIGPSVVSSLGMYALNPTLGTSVIVTSTTQDVKESAMKNGVPEQKAEKLGLGTGILVGALDRVFPERMFGGSMKLKNNFIGNFAKRLAESAVLEGSTEIAQEGVQMAAENTFRDIGMKEALQRPILAGLGGFLGGGGTQSIATFADTTLRQDIMNTPLGLSVQDINQRINELQNKTDLSQQEQQKLESLKRVRKTTQAKQEALQPLLEQAQESDSAEEFQLDVANQNLTEPIQSLNNFQNISNEQKQNYLDFVNDRRTETIQENNPEVAQTIEANPELRTQLQKYNFVDQFEIKQNSTNDNITVVPSKDLYNQITQEEPQGELGPRTREIFEGMQQKEIEEAQEKVEALKEEYEQDIYPANLAENVSKVYKQIEKSKVTGKNIGRTVQQETLLKEIEHGQEMAKREGYREAKNHLGKLKNAIYQYGKQKLDPDMRGKLNARIRDAKNYSDVMSAYSYINQLVETVQKKEIRNDIIDTQKKALNSPSVAADYKDRIRNLLSDYELQGHTDQYLERLRDTQEYVEQQKAQGKEVDLPDRILDNLAILSRQPLDQIPLPQMKAIQEEIKRLEEIGRTKWELKQQKYNREKEGLKQRLVDNATPIEKSNKFEREAPGEELSLTEKFRNSIRRKMDTAKKKDKVLLPIDALMDILDGGQATYDGAHYRLIKGQIDKDFNEFIYKMRELKRPVEELGEELDLDNSNYRRIGFVGALEQEGGKEKLKNLGFTEEDINNISLTENEQQFLDLIREKIQGQYPFVKQIMRDLYNKDVGEVENYLPFMTDWDATSDLEVQQRIGKNVDQVGMGRQQAFRTKKTPEGFTIERTGRGDQKIELNAMKIYQNHIENVAYMRSMARDAKMLFEIVNSDAYNEAAGDIGQALMLEYMDLIARKGRAAGQDQIQMLDTLRKNAGAGVLGLKLSSALIQWSPILDGAGEIGVKWETKGVKDFSSSRKWREFVLQFPEMQERTGAGETSVRELEDNLWGDIQRKGFIPLQKVDIYAAGTTAAGAYRKRMAELGKEIDLDSEPNQEAMEYAQQVMRQTQSSALFKDVPLAISKGQLTGNKSWDRALLQFQNYLLGVRWSRIRHDIIEGGIKGNKKRAARVAAGTITSMLASASMGVAAHRLKEMLLGEEEWEETLMKNMIFEMAGSVPFGGNIMSVVAFGGEPVPIFEALKKAPINFGRVFTSEDKTEALIQAISSTGQLTGVPGSYEFGQVVEQIMQAQEEGRGIELEEGIETEGIELEQEINLE